MIAPTLDPADLLPRYPEARWDGWFVIGIFPEGAPIAWLKLHVFTGVPEGAHALSMVEGIDGPGDLLTLVGGDRALFGGSRPLARREAEIHRDRFRLSVPGVAAWAGAWPEFEVRQRYAPPEGPAIDVRLKVEARGVFPWIRAGNLLSYWSAFSGLSAELSLAGKKIRCRGLGLFEHAWGTTLPFRIPRGLLKPWHWDVLAFHTKGAPHEGVAGLGLAPAFGRYVPLRGGGVLPGGIEAPLRGLKVRYPARGGRWVEGAEPPPDRWEGRLAGRGGVLEYAARATTPAARVVPGGGFLGFAFEGEWRPRRGPSRPLTGTGYTEYALP